MRSGRSGRGAAPSPCLHLSLATRLGRIAKGEKENRGPSSAANAAKNSPFPYNLLVPPPTHTHTHSHIFSRTHTAAPFDKLFKWSTGSEGNPEINNDCERQASSC